MVIVCVLQCDNSQNWLFDQRFNNSTWLWKRGKKQDKHMLCHELPQNSACYMFSLLQLPSSLLVPDRRLGRAENIVTSSTVPRSEGETGKDNSSRADSILKSVGFKQFILAIGYLKMALAIVFQS